MRIEGSSTDGSRTSHDTPNVAPVRRMRRLTFRSDLEHRRVSLAGIERRIVEVLLTRGLALTAPDCWPQSTGPVTILTREHAEAEAQRLLRAFLHDRAQLLHIPAVASAAGDSAVVGLDNTVSLATWRVLCRRHPELIDMPSGWRMFGFRFESAGTTVAPPLLHTNGNNSSLHAREVGTMPGASSGSGGHTASSAAEATTLWPQVLRVVDSLLAGGVAGACAKTVIAPGDRVKILFQVDSHRSFSLTAALKVGRTIVERSGIAGLWTGHGATLLRVVPYASINFAAFEVYHDAAKALMGIPQGAAASHKQDERSQALEWRSVGARFVAGAASGATSTTLTYPLDLFRARYAAHWDVHKRYPSYLSAVKDVITAEGPLALFSGLKPTILGIVPYAGVSFAAFETLKASIAAAHDHETELRPHERLLAGAAAGLVAQSATYPLDIVRRRMQVTPQRYSGVLSALVDIYRTEGRRGLYKGLSMNWIKGPIAVGISFTVNDLMKQRIRDFNRRATLAASNASWEDEEVRAAQEHRGGDGVSRTPPAGSTLRQSSEVTAFEFLFGHRLANAALTVEADNEGASLSLFERLVCGGLAGGLAKFWTIPFDRLRLTAEIGRFQHDGTPGDGVRQFRHLLLKTPHPWQGSAGMMLRVIPFAAVSYTAFDAFRPAARRMTYSKADTFASDGIAGALGSTYAMLWFHPLDVLRTRMAAAEPRPFISYWDGLRTYGRHPSQLYAGLCPALYGMVPLGALTFAVYHWGRRRWETTDDSFAARLALGMGAGLIGQAASYPINIVRRRALMDDALERSVLESLRTIVRDRSRHETVYRALYRRIPLGWAFSTTTISLSFALNDALRERCVCIRRSVGNELLLWNCGG